MENKNDSISFWTKVEVLPDQNKCWLWKNYRDDGGYGITCFEGKLWKAHRLAWQFTFGSIPEKLCICHKCDNPSCCNPYHLFLGTHNDNMKDMANKKRANHLIGERNPKHILSWQDVFEIRKRYTKKYGLQVLLAREYGVKPNVIHKIVCNVTWVRSALEAIKVMEMLEHCEEVQK